MGLILSPEVKMHAFARFFILSLIILPLLSLAQTYQHRMEGVYSLSLAGTTNPVPVNFTLSWNESGERIQGMYSDNYFTSNSAVSGNFDDISRYINVSLPPSNNGVKTLAIQFNRTSTLSGSETVRMTLYDATGMTLFNADQNVQIYSLPTSTSAPDTCTIGFGVLSKFCGVYSGTFTKSIDTGNFCQSVVTSDTVLDLSDDGELNIKLNYITGLTDLPAHRFGDIQHSPMNSNIMMTSRQCGQLAGTTFSPQYCRVLNLAGAFKEVAGVKSFTGSYVITDELTKESCTFNLNLERRATR